MEFKPGQYDAFHGLRVSQGLTLFDSKQIFDDAPLLWVNKETNGGAATYVQDEAATHLTVPANTASSVVRQTYRHFNYQPGKGFLCNLTGNLCEPKQGITTRIGYFDDNNGLFYEANEAGVCVVRRSDVSGSVVEKRVYQNRWLNRPSQNNFDFNDFDWTKAQIFSLDFEWLSLGNIRWGFFMNGIQIHAYEEDFANKIETPYMRVPNLPCRYEIINDGTGEETTIKHICCDVTSEGGHNPAGVVRSVDRGITATSNSADRIPVIAIRLKSDHLGATVNPIDSQVIAGATNGFLAQVSYHLSDTDLTGGTWVDLPDSSVQYNVSATAVSSPDAVMESDYSAPSGVASKSSEPIRATLDNALTLGSDVDGNRTMIVLSAQSLGSGQVYYGKIRFREWL